MAKHVGHVVPMKILLAVFGALVVLTWITVAITWVDLGKLNLWAALGIATVKASLVILYFMHLRYDRPMNAVVFIASLAFVALFVGGALLDTKEYQPELIPGYAPAVQAAPAAGGAAPAPAGAPAPGTPPAPAHP